MLTSIPMMLLAYAGSIKFAARNELFRLDDLKLTEAAGMAVNFLDFRFFLRANQGDCSRRIVLPLWHSGRYSLQKVMIPIKSAKTSRQKGFSGCLWVACVLS